MKILLILWKVYVVLLAVFGVTIIIFGSIPDYSKYGLWSYLDAFFSTIATVGLIQFVLNKILLDRIIWRYFTIFFIIWDLFYGFYVQTYSIHKTFDATKTLPILILFSLPIYLTLYFYFFKSSNN